MTLLDEQADRLLAQARKAFTPERTQADRVHAAVLASITVQSGSALTETLASSAKGPAGAAAGGGKVTSLAFGSSAKSWLAGVVVAVGLSSGGGIWMVARSKPQPHTITAPAAARSATRSLDVSSALASASARAGFLLAPPLTAPPPPARELTTPPPARELTTPTAPNASAPRVRLALREELAAVRAADESLNIGQPARALAILQELARASAGGELREEREALRVLAECQLGTPSALLGAERFLSTYENSVYAGRVRGACEP